MLNHDYLKIELASPTINVGNPLLNVEPILAILNKSKSGILLFPELSITGYTAYDLFFQKDFLSKATLALEKIINNTTYQGVYVLGSPLLVGDVLYNVAIVIQNQKILGVVPKYYLPNSKEFSEKRWFQPGIIANFNEVIILNQKVPFGDIIFEDLKNNIKFGVEVCQDMWAIHTKGDLLSLNGAHIILNPSASTEYLGKPELRINTIKDASRRQHSAYFYTTTSTYESTNDALFTSHKIGAVLGKLVINDHLNMRKESSYFDLDLEKIRYLRRIDQTYKDEQVKTNHSIKRVKVTFSNDKDYKFYQSLDKTPFIPKSNLLSELKLINEIQVISLMNKLKSLPNQALVIGVSAGLDSTLALLVAHQAFQRLKIDFKNLIAVTLPTHITSETTNEDSLSLMKQLNLEPRLIDIDNELKEHLKIIDHNIKDVTFENAQARIRTQVLMNLANKFKGIVLGTGDMSEIALGFMTFNGDQMSMYNVNSGIPKTLIKEMVSYHANHNYSNLKDILNKILAKKISPELKKNQVTEDIIGKYEINDFILYHHLENGAGLDKLIWLIKETFSLNEEESQIYANRFLDLFYQNQFKRIPMPEGVKVLNFSLSPRSDLKLSSMIKRG